MNIINTLPDDPNWILFQPSTNKVFKEGDTVHFDSAPIEFKGLRCSSDTSTRPDCILFVESCSGPPVCEYGFPHEWGCIILSGIELQVVRQFNAEVLV